MAGVGRVVEGRLGIGEEGGVGRRKGGKVRWKLGWLRVVEKGGGGKRPAWQEERAAYGS